MDIEEALAEEKKNREALNKELDAFNKKVKVITAALKAAELELEAFQVRNTPFVYEGVEGRNGKQL